MLSVKQICKFEIELVLKLIKVIFTIRFDAAAQQMRGAVLDNSFMGGECTLKRLKRNYYRIPANIERYEIKVGLLLLVVLYLLDGIKKSISKYYRDAQYIGNTNAKCYCLLLGKTIIIGLSVLARISMYL